jgi:predicted anti-sigma-YlaC factor YlaD
MTACSFDRLLQFVNQQLDPDRKLAVYDHLNRCDICRDAVSELSRDLDESSIIHRARRVKPSMALQPKDAAAGSPGAYR